MKKSLILTVLSIILLATSSIAEESIKGNLYKESEFLNKLDQTKYKRIKGTTKPITIKWDFNEGENITYNIEMIQQSTVDFGGGRDMEPRVTKSSAEGTFIFEGIDSKAADLIITLNTSTDFDKEKGPMSIKNKPIVLQEIDEYGHSDNLTRGQDKTYKILFPTLTSKIKKGQTVSISMEIPFNMMGNALKSTGSIEVTLTNFVLIGDIACARLESNILVDQVRKSKHIEGDYSFILKGKSIAYYDVKNDRFLKSEDAIVMHMFADAPVPEMDFGNLPDEAKKQMPKRSRMEMFNDAYTSAVLSK